MGAHKGVAAPEPTVSADYDADDDIRTLTRAAEISSDSKRLRAARKYFTRRHGLTKRALSSAKGLGGRR